MPLLYGTSDGRRDRRLEARPRPVRRRTSCACWRCSPATPRRRSSTRGSTRRNAARPRARRRCSSCRASSRPATELDEVARPHRVGSGADHGARDAPRSGSPTPGDRSARVPRDVAASTQPSRTGASGDRCPRASSSLARGVDRAVPVDAREDRCSTSSTRDEEVCDTARRASPFPLDRDRRDRGRRRRRPPTRRAASSSSWPGSPPGEAGDHERRIASRRSSGRSSRPSRRSRTRSRRRTSTPLPTRAGSATWRSGSARSSGSTPADAEARRARGALPRHRQDRDPGLDPDRSPGR